MSVLRTTTFNGVSINVDGDLLIGRLASPIPAGDGIGTASLVRALQQHGPGGYPYMVFVDDMILPTGDLRNPLEPDGRILFYRNNRTGRGPEVEVHNEKNFDPWASNRDRVFDGVNNWSPSVSPP